MMIVKRSPQATRAHLIVGPIFILYSFRSMLLGMFAASSASGAEWKWGAIWSFGGAKTWLRTNLTSVRACLG
jgi:hypothetical protein